MRFLQLMIISSTKCHPNFSIHYTFLQEAISVSESLTYLYLIFHAFVLVLFVVCHPQHSDNLGRLVIKALESFQQVLIDTLPSLSC